MIPGLDYLIDGYDLAHWLASSVVGGDDFGPAELRTLLLGTLAPRLPRDARSVHVYWDVRQPAHGVPLREDLGWCVAHNVPDADAAIIDAVYDAASPRQLVVVSRDREVTGKSRQLGARVLGPAELLGEGPDGRGPGGGRGGRGGRGRRRRR